MDVSVSHLNNRLALQLPAQLSLGLVFVLGDIENFINGENGRSHKQFNLIEKEHRVRCLLTERVALDVDLQEGDTIRAGGHLVFDSTQADYYLLVRDVEILQSQAVESKTVAASQADMELMMADARKRAEAAEMAQGDLPSWVKKMSPVEYSEDTVEANDDIAMLNSNGDEVEKKQLAQLSEAFDSDEDVELTSGLLDVAKKLNQARGLQVEDDDILGIPAPVMGSRYAYPTDVEDPDAYTPTGKSTADRILVLIIIIALMLFLLIMLILLVRGF